ncbi:hypothetical protein QF023_003656 [Chryseobacterium sp. SLBN-27]|jgi:hypothetical protein|nr:hypothetical protein [Chryseobacterium sp. SLBN-27]
MSSKFDSADLEFMFIIDITNVTKYKSTTCKN